MKFPATLCLALAAIVSSGCATTHVENPNGIAPQTFDSAVRGPVSGIGIEGQDIVSMTDQMMRDMLGNPRLVSTARAPRVIIDAEFFANDGAQPINRNTITDRLRVNLNRASQGRMTFVGRQYASMVQQERDLKRQGVTDVGTTGLAKAQAGGDYRLGGRIATVDARNPRTGIVQRYNQVTFEMIDLESSEIVWSGMYEFSRAAADNVIYR
jgi:PBP1b-binding outer membrane lipoprotein LpoB